MLYSKAIIIFYVFFMMTGISCSQNENKKKAISTCSFFAHSRFDIKGKLQIVNDTVYVLTKKDFDKGFAENNFTIQNASNENIIIESISICDIQGQVVLEEAVNLQEAHVNISTLITGMYFITIKTDKGIKVEKLVKE